MITFICEDCASGQHTLCRGGTWCDCQHWRRSGYCANGACVEVRLEDGRVLVRDSKNPGEPISFMPQTWMSTVLAPVMLDRLPAFVEPSGGGYVWSGYSVDGEFLRLRFDAGEWEAFTRGVKAGEFNVEALA